MSTPGSLYAGLISGTSIDGVDAALVRFGDRRCETVATHAEPYPGDLREELLRAVADPNCLSLDDVGRIDHTIGASFAAAANALFEAAAVQRSDVAAIGSHGQTLRHRIDTDTPFSLQLGDPNLIAQRTGVTTVADFRRRDVAAGGEGAPLAPGFHDWLFGAAREPRCVLNLGGIANLTVLSGDGSPVVGFDTGPASTLMDAWIREHRGEPYDVGGAWAKTGAVVEDLLQRLLGDDYFSRPPPKSTGFEHFNLAWLRRHLGAAELAAADVQATLMALTVRSVADGVSRHGGGCSELLLCGGGVHNDELVARLRSALAPLRIASTAEHGLHPDWVEAALCAWLARQTMNQRPGNVPSVTGAATAEVLGGVYYAGRARAPAQR